MTPTEAARALLPHARRTLEEADLGVRAVRDAVDDEGRALRIGVTPGAPPTVGVLVAGTHPLAGVHDVDWSDLDGRDLLLYARDLAPGYHDALLADCAAAGWRPRAVRPGPPRRSLFAAELRHGGDVVALRSEWDSAEGLRWLPLRTAVPRVRHALVWDPAHESADRMGKLAPRLAV